ncbi:hypothetical protein HYW55_00960 [Candidatus Gottesmanbacteria bacterium]|nr:hypothetical protein [Candidatus Gottesmanbacteria bacterium]
MPQILLQGILLFAAVLSSALVWGGYLQKLVLRGRDVEDRGLGGFLIMGVMYAVLIIQPIIIVLALLSGVGEWYFGAITICVVALEWYQFIKIDLKFYILGIQFEGHIVIDWESIQWWKRILFIIPPLYYLYLFRLIS